MLVVLEGCDGTGKSTMAKRIASVLNAEIIHCSTKTPNDYMFFHGIIGASKTHNIVADRFFYGQFVYQTPKDRHLTHSDLVDLEVELLGAGGKVILVEASEQDIANRLGARDEQLINGLTIKEVLEGFRKMASDSFLPVEIWNTSTGIDTRNN